MDGPARIAAAFAAAKGRAAFMPYLMGGFPDVATSLAIGEAYVDGGADLIELGVPFSDPLADGPVVHAAGTTALENGTTVDDVLAICERLSARVPVVMMMYANLVLARGPEAFAQRIAARGAAGLIVPDLPLEEADAVLAACDAAGVALVPLVAPTTPDDRMARIGARARGFVYTVSVVGTTGERASLSDTFASLVTRAKASTDVPVALGFGIGNPDQAVQAAAAGADGVIVGSRLVRAAAEADDPPAAVRELVSGFTEALAAAPLR
jgi:tryptophan synthase alpha chain